jgi:hypothetical protein
MPDFDPQLQECRVEEAKSLLKQLFASLVAVEDDELLSGP